MNIRFVRAGKIDAEIPVPVDYAELTKDLAFAGSWNIYCLAKSSERFVRRP